jgi:hypothetical protein
MLLATRAGTPLLLGCVDAMLPTNMVDASLKPYIPFADYLEAEQPSDVKHEWFDGSVYAMSRGRRSMPG